MPTDEIKSCTQVDMKEEQSKSQAFVSAKKEIASQRRSRVSFGRRSSLDQI